MASRLLPDRDDVLTAIDLTTGDELATETEVLTTAARLSSRPRAAVREVFDQLEKRGEIYTYPQGGHVVVRITGEVL